MSVAAEFDRPVEILLAEDSPTDAQLTKEALATCETEHRVHVVTDGAGAIAFLLREPPYSDAPRPDLVLLDLKMPRKDGCEVLEKLKTHDDLKAIPVIVLTTSIAETDVRGAYAHHANSYVVKPLDFGQFVQVMKVVEQFWFKIATLPSH
ncbi:MAG: response regulator [Planctomycetota bacterium]|nr:response regulator [Planctomycetota bacterium]